MTLDEIKNFIKVDYSDDDDYIKMLIDAGEDYITDAVGTYDDDNARHRMLLTALVDAAYNSRSYTVGTDDKAAYIVRSICAQLREGW